MDKKIQWGILGAATIARQDVIPAMLKSKHCSVLAIAARNLEKAEKAAKEFRIPKYYQGYQDLLDDKEIEAVYIPLPNHLHVTWAKKALIAGKHVLVEKPIALSSEEARDLLATAKRYPKLKIAEAFMYKYHPQWMKVKQLVDTGEIGTLKTIQSSFSFFENAADHIVNNKQFGGGSLMDIGCYSISISRLLFGSEPKSVVADIEYHPEFKVDILATAILAFEGGTSSFFCATQLVDNQQLEIFGTKGSIKFELPFNPPIERPAKIWVTKGELMTEMEFELCDQYALQVDALSLAILNDNKTPAPLEDAVNNMVVIEKLHESHKLGRRVYV